MDEQTRQAIAELYAMSVERGKFLDEAVRQHDASHSVISSLHDLALEQSARVVQFPGGHAS